MQNVVEPRPDIAHHPLLELLERPAERRGQALAEDRLLALRGIGGVCLLATASSLLGAEVVEGRAPGKLTEPGAGGGPGGVEPAPAAECPLERLGGQVFG